MITLTLPQAMLLRDGLIAFRKQLCLQLSTHSDYYGKESTTLSTALERFNKLSDTLKLVENEIKDLSIPVTAETRYQTWPSGEKK